MFFILVVLLSFISAAIFQISGINAFVIFFGLMAIGFFISHAAEKITDKL